jgi:hypothetical protein
LFSDNYAFVTKLQNILGLFFDKNYCLNSFSIIMFSNKKYTAGVIVILTLILLSVLGIGVWNSFNPKETVFNMRSSEDRAQKNSKISQSENSQFVQSTISSTLPKPIQITSVKMNTLFLGEVFWGRYIDDWSKLSPLKYDYPFSGLNTLEREKYDAWIADMECPITSTYIDSVTQDDTLAFSCPSEYTASASKWFSAFTLANNHTDNMEQVNGLGQTRDDLEKNKIQYFGHFDNAIEKDICEIVSLPARTQDVNNKEVKVSFPIALCGYHNVFKLPTESQIAVINQYSKYFPTIVMPHQGKEYTYQADGLQEDFARQYIDQGADAVVGTHVHSVQNTEVYKNKLIVYSLGNFIFDQQASPQVRRGFALNLDFNYKYDSNLQKFIDLGIECQKFQDNCLQKAIADGLKKPSFTINYDAIPLDNSNKLAKKATPEIASEILARINWQQTAEKLTKTNKYDTNSVGSPNITGLN